jgi:MoaF-like
MGLTSNKSREFIAYPTNRVVGTVDDPGAAQAAVESLIEAGFDIEGIEVLYGEEGLRRLDPTGKEQGFLARVQRAAFHWHEEDKYLRQHVEDILAGRFVIMVLAKEPENREKVREILKSHGGHFIKFFGNWAIQSLDIGAFTPADPAEYESYLPDVGHIYEVHFDSGVLNVRYESEEVMTLTDQAKGTSETVRMSTTQIRPGVLMFSWQDASKATAVHIVDFENGIVYANTTQLDGNFVRMKGTLKRLQ